MRYACLLAFGAAMVAASPVAGQEAGRQHEHEHQEQEQAQSHPSGQQQGAGHAEHQHGEHEAMRTGEVAHPTTAGEKFVAWLGEFHPPIINLPIGLLYGALIAELIYMMTRAPGASVAARYCVAVGCTFGVIAGVLGWCFGGFDPSADGWMLGTHRWLGTTTAAGALVLLIVSEISHRRNTPGLRTAYRVLLLAAVALVTVTGFFGGAMIYGLDHYNWPA